MASFFSHALMAITIGKTYSEKIGAVKFLTLGCVCAIFPDLDVLMFNFVSYDHFLGHRGFFHSLFFCLILSVLITAIFYRKEKTLSFSGFRYILFFFLCAASHGLLDMLTDGGLGVAIFSPFNNERYFFPWRPVEVSPIGIQNFFSEWGLSVIKSELIWIGIPCLCYMGLMKIMGLIKKHYL